MISSCRLAGPYPSSSNRVSASLSFGRRFLGQLVRRCRLQHGQRELRGVVAEIDDGLRHIDLLERFHFFQNPEHGVSGCCPKHWACRLLFTGASHLLTIFRFSMETQCTLNA